MQKKLLDLNNQLNVTQHVCLLFFFYLVKSTDVTRVILSKRNEIRPTKQLFLQNHIINYEH